MSLLFVGSALCVAAALLIPTVFSLVRPGGRP